MPYFKPTPNTTDAYHNDGTHEYYGAALRGTLTSESRWQICKIEYATGYDTAGDNWITKYPNGDDSPLFEWDEVESYDYYILRKRGSEA